jgi:hypothetical protein
LTTLRGNRTYKPKAQETSGCLRSSLLINACLFSYKEPLFIGGPGDTQSPQLYLFHSRQTDLHAFQGYNSNSLLHTGHQRVFTRSSLIYTRRLLSLLRTAPFTRMVRLHVACSSDEARATTCIVPSALKRPMTSLQPWEVSEASHMTPSHSALEPSRQAGFLIHPHLRR